VSYTVKLCATTVVGKHVTLVVPVYNDWDSLRILLREFDEPLSREYRIHVVIVDDSSTQPQPYELSESA
jgi:hypothetical protein